MNQPAEEVNSRPEPIFEQEPLRISALHVLLREWKNPQVFCGSWSAAQADPTTVLQEIVTCRNDDPTVYPCMGHILRGQYANLHFDVDGVGLMRNMVWVCGVGALFQHDMVETFCCSPKVLRRMVHH